MKNKKRRTGFRINFLILLLMVILAVNCSTAKLADNRGGGAQFSFVFFTDIHLQPEKMAVEGFRQAINRACRYKPEFLLTGGDSIMDALEAPYERAESLYDLFLSEIKNINPPVFHTIGNHEVFGWYPKSGVKNNHPMFGKKLFETKLGKRYYSFDYKGWHFIILDSIMRTEDSEYEGRISDEQIVWLREDLKNTENRTPIIISTHIPLLSVAYYYRKGNEQLAGPAGVVQNSKVVLDLFKNHNLKLVLQGHLHYHEYIVIQGITFVSVGAVAGKWWEGDYHGTQEGFGLIKIKGDEFEYKYIDSGWEVTQPTD